jgi:hypothetical protein
MNQAEAASPPLSPLDPRRARLRTRPSGLKGRCRDRCATGLRSALDPGASTGPQPGQRRACRTTALPATAAALSTDIKIKIPTIKSPRFQGIASARCHPRS